MQPGVVHIGWLGRDHPYPHGAVRSVLVQKLKRLCAHPVEMYRGVHVCELCIPPEEIGKSPGDLMERHRIWWEWAKHRASNGEIRVSTAALTYAAPLMITHYIEEHGYCPPAEFLAAVEEQADP